MKEKTKAMIKTDRIKRAIRATMDVAGHAEHAMREAHDREKSRLKSLFFELVRIRAEMIDSEDRIKRLRHPERWK